MTDNISETSPVFTFKKAMQLCRKLHLGNNDVILLKRGSSLASLKGIDNLVHAIEKLNVNAMVAVVDDFNNLAILDETQMRKMGWMRIDQMNKLLGIKDKKQ